MKELIKPVIREDIPEVVKEAVSTAKQEFKHRKEVIRLSNLLQYVENRDELRYLESKILSETSSMVFHMTIKEKAEERMSSKELSMYKSML